MAFDVTQKAYIDLRNTVSERSDALVAWVGAGLSMSAGLPSWERLRQILVEDLNDLARALSDPKGEERIVDLCPRGKSLN